MGRTDFKSGEGRQTFLVGSTPTLFRPIIWTMAEKLNSGDTFPKLTLNVVDGGKLELPDGLDAKYKVILFYRGHW